MSNRHHIASQFCLLIIVLLAVTSPARLVRADALDEGFRTPPDLAKPHTWWHWVSGNISKEGITADLEAMKRIGLGGAQVFSVDQAPNPKDRGTILYMSPEWREMTKHAIAEADRLGLILAIHACEGWNESGGSWITPEQSMQKVVWTAQQVTGPVKFDQKLRQPERVKDFYRDIVVLAYPSLPGEREDQSPTQPASRPAATTATTAGATATMAAAAASQPRWRIPDYIAKSGMASKVLPDTPPTTQPDAEDIIPRAKLTDLTRQVDAAGQLTWDVPPGKWTILRMGHTSTGKTNSPAMAQTRGLECDKMSADAVKAFFDGMLAKVIEDSKPLIGKGLKFVLMDSWEARCQNWTPAFRQEFQTRRGYDPLPWLATLSGRYVESNESTERFLWDMRRTIADLIAEHHFGLIRELSRQNGLQVTGEAVGIKMPTIADQFECKGRTDIPMGEFWVNEFNDNGDTREAASAAHIYGKTFAAAEAFTARTQNAAWKNDPYSLKLQGDEQFCMGINRFVFHRYAHQPWLDRTPGMTMGPWGINFERTNTWWEPARAWISYISRSQYLLQRGLFVGDLVYYYGEGAPRCLTPSQLTPKPPAGYDYDGCGTEVLLTRMSVKDGRIVLPDGMSYRVLVLPNEQAMTPKVAKKIKELVSAGATVYGPKPSKSPSLSGFPACDDEVKSIAAEVWGDNDAKAGEHALGKGKVVWGKPITELIGAPRDFESTTPDGRDANFRYIHRRDGDVDIYFVANPKNEFAAARCAFRVTDKQPELWYPDTGVMETAAAYKVEAGRTIVPLRFDRAGSVFVIFRKAAASADSIISMTRGGTDVLAGEGVAEFKGGALEAWEAGTYEVTTAGGKTKSVEAKSVPKSIELTGPWKVQFPPKLGAPESVEIDKLISWPDHADDGVKHFSGTATYTRSLEIPADLLGEGKHVYLDLGNVKNLAEVSVNGQNLGILWKPPFRVDLTSAAKPGANELEVKVTNLWPNRLIGDAGLPPDKRVTWTAFEHYKAGAPLLPSGLIGPVKLVPTVTVPLK